MSMFLNRLQKRYKHLRKFASRWPTNAFRIYDWDIPEYPWTVDVYGDYAYAQEFVRRKMTDAEREEQEREVVEAVRQVLEIAESAVVTQRRRRQKGDAQYEKQADRGDDFTVFEGEHRFWVNLYKYVDTGLFLDHRNLRRIVAEEVAARKSKRGRAPQVLNLFAYTGAFSVWAAAAGAEVHTVDLSNTYLDWAKRNFELNGLSLERHMFRRSDVLRFLPQELRRRRNSYDVIVLDPPTFSRSKKMERDLDVQRDYVDLVNGSLRLLADGGTLYFSTNFREFEMEPARLEASEIEEITHQTVPDDFRPGIHRAWKIVE